MSLLKEQKVKGLDSILGNPESIEILGSRIQPGQSIIVSVWPGELVQSVPHAGQVTYRLPEAAKDRIRGVMMNPQRLSTEMPDPTQPDAKVMEEETVPEGQGFSFLICCDTRQFVRDPQTERIIGYPIPAHVAAEGLLHEWLRIGAKSQVGQAGMRIWDRQQPLAELLADLQKLQRILFREMIISADTDWAAERFDAVTDAHRKAARWMNEERAWCLEKQIQAKKTCLLCGELIPAMALKCKGCGSFLADEYTKRKIDPAGDVVVASYIAKNSAAPARA